METGLDLQMVIYSRPDNVKLYPVAHSLWCFWTPGFGGIKNGNKDDQLVTFIHRPTVNSQCVNYPCDES